MDVHRTALGELDVGEEQLHGRRLPHAHDERAELWEVHWVGVVAHFVDKMGRVDEDQFFQLRTIAQEAEEEASLPQVAIISLLVEKTQSPEIAEGVMWPGREVPDREVLQARHVVLEELWQDEHVLP